MRVRLRSQNREFSTPRGEKTVTNPQKHRDDGNSSAVVSGSVPTRRVRSCPRQPRTPVHRRRPPDTRSTSYPVGGTRWLLQTPVCHRRATKKKIRIIVSSGRRRTTKQSNLNGGMGGKLTMMTMTVAVTSAVVGKEGGEERGEGGRRGERRARG